MIKKNKKNIPPDLQQLIARAWRSLPLPPRNILSISGKNGQKKQIHLCAFVLKEVEIFFLSCITGISSRPGASKLDPRFHTATISPCDHADDLDAVLPWAATWPSCVFWSEFTCLFWPSSPPSIFNKRGAVMEWQWRGHLQSSAWLGAPAMLN